MQSKLIVPFVLALVLVSTSAAPFAGRAHAMRPAAPSANGARGGPHVLERTRFVLYVGIAAFCIHYVFKHYQYGDYSSGANHRIQNIAKAAAALFIAYNRLKAADGVAHKSHSKTLHTLAIPLDKLVGSTDSEYRRLHNGQLSGKDVAHLYAASTAFTNLSGSSGYAIHEVATQIP